MLTVEQTYISMLHCNKRINFRHLRPNENNPTYLYRVYTGIRLSFRWPWDKKKLKNGEEKNPTEMLFSTYQNKRAGRADCVCVHVCIRMMYVYVWCQTSRALCSIWRERYYKKKSSKLAIYKCFLGCLCPLPAFSAHI